MGLHRKNTYHQLNEIYLQTLRGVRGTVTSEEFELAMNLIHEQQIIIANTNTKIKNLRNGLKGISSGYERVNRLYQTASKAVSHTNELYNLSIKKQVAAEMRSEELERTLKEVLNIESVKERINKELKEVEMKK